MRFIFRHIARQKAKSALVVLVALFFILALGWLQATISRAEEEIDRLYETTFVRGVIRAENPNEFGPMRFLGNTMRAETLARLRESGLVRDLYIRAAHDWAVILPARADGGLPENWYEIAELDLELDTTMFAQLVNPLGAASCLDTFRRANSVRYFDDIPGVVRQFDDFTNVQNFYINFGEGFDEATLDEFVFSPENDGRIPIVLAEDLAEFRGLSIGDLAYISVTLGITQVWAHYPAIVVGTHNRNIIIERLRSGALMPLSALEYITTDVHVSYVTLEFYVDPALNREIIAVQEELRGIARAPQAAWGHVRLGLTLDDSELRNMVGTVDQTLGLLRLLYPVVVVVSAAIAIGLAMILMLQNAKNAAIMRVLGGTKRKTQVIFCAEVLILCLVGLVFGLFAVAVFDLHFGLFHITLLAVLYFAGTFAGAVTGAVMITRRPPLELLQVKE